jgi:hypothetical protein
MKTCSVSEAKSSLGKLADEAIKGRPTVITRGGKLVILRAYEPPDPDVFDPAIDAGMKSEHFEITDRFWQNVRIKGRKLARQQTVKSGK